MTTIKHLASLIAAIPTLTPTPGPTAAAVRAEPRACGEVNVFYSGFPPYHPLVVSQGWDPMRVDIGLKTDTANLIQAGYNVHVVWAGTEIPITTLEDRMAQTGVEFDVVAIGFGIRGARSEAATERFEDIIDMYQRKAPKAWKTFNHGPDSLLWSVQHRIPTTEDCKAAGKPGKLLGYEEICDSRCAKLAETAKQKLAHNEL